jgi:quercetin dioxygenase-like cupin family protein
MRVRFERPASVVLSSVAVIGLLIASQATPSSQTPSTSPASHHVLLSPGQLQWGPAPPALPAGAQMAVLNGDPSQATPFSVSVKFPTGYIIPPHWHPTDENVVVVEGSLAVGMGDSVDTSPATTLGPGGYALLPKEMHHYAKANSATTIVVYGTGPFAINYVTPADDPRGKAAPSKPSK